MSSSKGGGYTTTPAMQQELNPAEAATNEKRKNEIVSKALRKHFEKNEDWTPDDSLIQYVRLEVRRKLRREGKVGLDVVASRIPVEVLEEEISKMSGYDFIRLRQARDKIYAPPSTPGHVIGQDRCRVGQCVSTQKPGGNAMYIAIITANNTDGTAKVLFKGVDYSEKEVVTLEKGHEFRYVNMADMKGDVIYTEEEHKELRAKLDAEITEDEHERLEQGNDLTALHQSLRQRACKRFTKFFSKLSNGSAHSQQSAADFMAWEWSAQQVLPLTVFSVEVADRNPELIVIDCHTLGGENAATVELAPNASLYDLQQAIQQQGETAGRMQLIGPKGNVLKAYEGTIAELLPDDS